MKCFIYCILCYILSGCVVYRFHACKNLNEIIVLTRLEMVNILGVNGKIIITILYVFYSEINAGMVNK